RTRHPGSEGYRHAPTGSRQARPDMRPVPQQDETWENSGNSNDDETALGPREMRQSNRGGLNGAGSLVSGTGGGTAPARRSAAGVKAMKCSSGAMAAPGPQQCAPSTNTCSTSVAAPVDAPSTALSAEGASGVSRLACRPDGSWASSCSSPAAVNTGCTTSINAHSRSTA